MQAHINSIIAVFFLLIGAIAVGLMLELKGKPKDRLMNRQMILAHRILGYAFVVLYMIMLYIMIVKSSNYQEELSPRAILHVAMAVALMPLIVIKILIARRYKVMTGRLLGLGVGILITAFVLSSITAGHYLLHYEDISYTSITAVDSDILDEQTGRYFLQQKCSKCHTFERVFRAFKTEQGWANTVNRMAQIDAPNIRSFEVKQIIHFLVRQQARRKGDDFSKIQKEIGKTLVSQKCSVCHELDRVIQAVKKESEWRLTVERMMQHASDPDFLTQGEKGEIIRYLTQKR